ncbi:MAG: response regulator transcription factor [Dehalococcoidia bacterium]|nr:response regulator transcription factor [Dehalococcoidia bacterium]
MLIVDDDPEILTALSIHLRADGYRVLRAASGAEALAALATELPALAIVDLMMPGMDGFETSRRLKRRADIPIVILTAIDTEETKVRAIELYADDYVTKPFSYPELAARIGRILKRAWPAGPPASAVQVDADLTIDFAGQNVRVRGETRRLTPTETRLLHLLYANAGRILPNELILDRVWPDAEGEMSYLWEYIRRLREKLGDDPAHPRYLASERGVGYRFIPRSG